MERITAILDSGDFAQFVGMPEDIDLEAKQQPYDLGAASDRYELAKDVSSLANSSGGYLLIGLSTRREPNRQIDIIDGLTPIAQAAMVVTQYEGIIDTHVFPRIEGMRVVWREHGGTNMGLGAILVPRQNEDRKPFIIAKVVEDGEYLKEIIVGYAERSADANDPLTPRKLYDAMKQGRDSHSQRLTRMEGMLGRLLQQATTPPATAASAAAFNEAELRARIDSIVEDSE